MNVSPAETQSDVASIDETFWTNDNADKQTPDLIEKLEQRAHTGVPMLRFKLRRANLAGLNLVNPGSHTGFTLSHSDLYRADLSGGHFFNTNFSDSSLMKANFNGANLHCANFSNCNLLGTNFENTKLENVSWDKELLQEKLAKRARTVKEKNDYYQQAEEVYRHLRKVTESQGLFETAGVFFQREMVMRRYQMPKYSFDRCISKMVDIFCGYGEQPFRVIVFSMLAICLFATIYFFSGITESGELIRYYPHFSFYDNFINFLRCSYFSVVTFTTLGYGDLAPTGITRLFAASEAFIGSFTLALFVVVFVKKMTR
ncbi:MAG: pentapeptide repeat-containing protein [Hahellaceae bacterium]|nr:pentapeptide repeat-containing protein [Hahellaceae bacterium]MCP5212193.1 pentapeptide repeat-containing protein [Hahellaceae bacterium]